MKLYKVTGPGGTACHGGTGTWTPGEWRSVEGPLVPCENGLHLVPAHRLIDWLGAEIWEVETEGELIDAGNKWVARKARTTRRAEAWNEQTARHFAADCAEDVLHLVDPAWRETIEVVLHTIRAYADGAASEEERAAAEAAAEAAAGAAARAAAEAAVATRAWDATGATGAGAKALAVDRQNARLFALLGIKP
jgi:hypothetical protein